MYSTLSFLFLHQILMEILIWLFVLLLPLSLKLKFYLIFWITEAQVLILKDFYQEGVPRTTYGHADVDKVKLSSGVKDSWIMFCSYWHVGEHQNINWRIKA